MVLQLSFLEETRDRKPWRGTLKTGGISFNLSAIELFPSGPNRPVTCNAWADKTRSFSAVCAQARRGLDQAGWALGSEKGSDAGMRRPG